jgi:glycosyltransferase involved in cell wall biosynthesis
MFLMSDAFRSLRWPTQRPWHWPASTILLVSCAWDPSRDGAEALAGRRLLHALLEVGARVHVLAGGRARDECEHPNYRLTVVPRPPFAGHKFGRACQMLRSTVPESEGRWVGGAVHAGTRLLLDLPGDTIVYSRASPGASNVAAWLLTRAVSRPWTAHFSDEWPSVSVLARGRRWLAPYKAPLFAFWRNRIARDAGALTFTNPRQAVDVYGSNAPQYRAKTFVVTHLPSDRRAPNSAVPVSDTFELVHTGNLYAGQTAGALLEGLRRFLDRTPGARSCVRFTQAGWCHGDIPDWTDRLGLADVVRCTGPLSASAVLDLVDGASLLIAIDYARPGSRTLLSKLPDYIHAGRPILAITGADTSLARLFYDDGAGLVARYDSPQDVAARLAEVFAAWRARNSEVFLPRPTAVDSFSRRRVLSELAAAFGLARASHARTSEGPAYGRARGPAPARST